MNEIKNYYLIFFRDCENAGHLVFIVESEDVAIQFCNDFKNYYYLSREQVK